MDGFRLGPAAPKHVAVVDGDTKSAAIAAASIVAKVTRDRLMRRLDALYPRYGFSSHVGYITPGHSAAVREHGPSEQHRLSFNALALCAARARRATLTSAARPATTACGATAILGANVWAGGYELDLIVAARPPARLLRGEGEDRPPASATRSRWSTRRRRGACTRLRRRGSRGTPSAGALDVPASRSSPCARARWSAASRRFRPASVNTSLPCRSLPYEAPEGTIPNGRASSSRLRPGRAGRVCSAGETSD